MKKPCGSGEVEFRITVWEYVKPRDPEMSFFAQADKYERPEAGRGDCVSFRRSSISVYG